ncbi:MULTISPECIES: hypothetical protein [Sphingomonas]|uniref:hypothetical protein n=1 Tax=Sphingomonas TaxID=13687 RepID=UPI000F7E56B3|nr:MULTISPECIES: hypothetical protein [Sphingomonas]
MSTINHSRIGAMRPIALFAVIFLVPPVLWALIIWTDKLPSSWSHPFAAYGLLALVMLPGFAGIWFLRVRRSTKFLMMPLYCAGMIFTLFFWGLLFACGAMNDCP